MSPGELSADRRPRSRSPRVTGGGWGSRVAQGSRLLRARGALGCAAGAGRRRPPRRSLTKSDGPARGPTVLRGPGGPAGTPDEWRGEEALPAWAPAPGRSPKASKPPARGLRVPADSEPSACRRTHLRAGEIGAASSSSLLSWVEAPRPPSLQV